jgi:hypothetical protein
MSHKAIAPQARDQIVLGREFEHGDSLNDRWLHALYLMAIPWVELLVNPNLFIIPSAPNAYIDPWLYTGYFLSLPDYLLRFPGTYYGSRLSWLVPGYVAHKVFSPLVANYVLHIGFFYVLLAATYALVRSGVNRHAAILVTIVLAWSPVILGALGWDYVDGAGIVFIVVAMLCFEKAVQAGRRRWAWSVAAGVPMGCMASSNAFLMALWPVFGLFVLLRVGSARWRDVVRIVVMAGVGIGLALLLLAFIDTRLGGPWLFLAPQLNFGRTLVASPNPWKLPSYSWLWRATWLVLPVVAAVGALVSCLKPAPSQPSFGRAMQVVLLAAVALWVVVQTVGTPVLQIEYYSSYLAPLALIALPLQDGEPGAGLSRRAIVVLELATFVLFALVDWQIVPALPGFWTRAQPWLEPRLTAWLWGSLTIDRETAFATLVGAGAGLAAVVSLRAIDSARLRWIIFALGLAVMCVAGPACLPSAKLESGSAFFEETVAAHRFISQHIGGRELRFWYKCPPGTKTPMRSISSTYLWGPVLLNYNEEMPVLSREQAKQLGPQTRLVLLAPTVQETEAARAPLRTFGLDYHLVTQREFGSGDMSLAVVIVDLARLGDVAVR